MKAKKLISVVLALALALCLAPGIALAADPAGAGVTVTDCGHFKEATWGGEAGVFSVGWKYSDTAMLDEVVSVRVGAKDAKDRVVVEYTADAEQIDWQQANGYVTAEGLSSVPFYKEYNGEPVAEGRDSDWTMAKGAGFDMWQPTLFYVEVETAQGTYYDEMAYDYPYPDVVITDCGHFNEATWGGEAGVFSVGWKYSNLSLDDVTAVRVGAKDAKDRIVVEYTADEEQIDWQLANGYITAEGLSSVPFYKEYNGEPIAEGRDSDWTMAKGAGFDTWQPTLFYVEVETAQGTYYDEMAYSYDYPHVHEAVAVPAKAATEEEPGNIAYWYCPDCGKYFRDEALTEEISLEDTVIPVLEHTHSFGEDWQSDADNHWKECACGEIADLGEHTFGDWVVTKEATATEPGSQMRACTVCGYSQTEELAATGATEEPAPTEPGATEEPEASQEGDAPKTNDDTNLALWIALLVVAAGGMTAAVIYTKKRGRQH